MSDQCIIHGCTNRKNQGIFIGDICLPCSNMLVSGDPKFGVTFVHKMRDRIEELEAKLARYDDLVADKINLRSENETLKAKLRIQQQLLQDKFMLVLAELDKELLDD